MSGLAAAATTSYHAPSLDHVTLKINYAIQIHHNHLYCVTGGRQHHNTQLMKWICACNIPIYVGSMTRSLLTQNNTACQSKIKRCHIRYVNQLYFQHAPKECQSKLPLQWA